jgi:hypothetical protein
MATFACKAAASLAACRLTHGCARRRLSPGSNRDISVAVFRVVIRAVILGGGRHELSVGVDVTSETLAFGGR